MDPSGTRGGSEFIILEAECSDGSGDEEEEGEGEDGEFEVADFVDDASNSMHLALFNRQMLDADNEQVQQLKRKYASPSSAELKVNNDLSPRLAAIIISPERKAKRRLFMQEDSGYGPTLETQAQTEMGQNTQVEVAEGGDRGELTEAEEEEAEDEGEESTGVQSLALQIQLLKARDNKLAKLGMFKRTYGVSFSDLTREFKSDKSINTDWVVVAFGVHDTVVDSSMELLKPHCVFVHATCEQSAWGFIMLFLLCFKTGKSRATVERLMCSIAAVRAGALLAEPPKVRSAAAAVYWYKGMLTNVSKAWGQRPKWILNQVSITHISQDSTPFDLSEMIQWAYDNQLTEECKIAYEYAKCADTCSNAAAFLKSNCQARYVKDCAIMVRHYLRAEMQSMSMGSWIERQRNKVEGEGNWKVICNFLKYQGVEFVPYQTRFKLFLRGVPKKNCLCFYGPPNTGKSAFCMSLIKFFSGRVVSHMNSKSTFWLQPLLDAKVGLLDDATEACWDFMDTYMRNALDGNMVCIDSKHRAPQQCKFPPLLMTSNIDIRQSDRWKYLHSRVTMVHFPNEFPLTEEGECVYELTEQNWKSYFGRCWAKLECSDEEDEGYDGDAQPAFRCTARSDDGPV
nr:MAG: E1 protein [Leptonychotes weddellii papillomavirus 8]